MKRLAAALALLTVFAALLIRNSQAPAAAQSGCETLSAGGRPGSDEATFRIAAVAPLPCVFISDGSVV
ncbi:MAG: hypothetical protein WD178_09260, partial [Actinomycetota bacterium]